MDVFDEYYELDEQEQKKVNLQLLIDAGHLIDIQGYRYTWELQAVFKMKTEESYRIFENIVKKIEPTSDDEDYR